MTGDEAKAIFRSLSALCGLDYKQLAVVIGRSPQTARHKMAGTGPVVQRDLDVLADLWSRIDAGEDSLTGPPAEHSRAIAWVRSRTSPD
ncbi:hypothetical protein [Aurantimonas coralicida]|uniref:hypothetical protein n=1 Tax=Aurantimonas coralicida TaxID=182270 RepID=UPI001D194548|nr:hypothetical protein [Aurantimonas coralicida]MCC4298422.1 hypothetical protein [Aurantimonas coralicida]